MRPFPFTLHSRYVKIILIIILCFYGVSSASVVVVPANVFQYYTYVPLLVIRLPRDCGRRVCSTFIISRITMGVHIIAVYIILVSVFFIKTGHYIPRPHVLFPSHKHAATLRSVVQTLCVVSLNNIIYSFL